MKNHLNEKRLRKVAESIFVSKISYSLQLLGKVKSKEDQPSQIDFEKIQLIQNKMARLLEKTKISEHKTTKSIVNNINMLSVNQMNAQIKLNFYCKYKSHFSFQYQ